MAALYTCYVLIFSLMFVFGSSGFQEHQLDWLGREDLLAAPQRITTASGRSPVSDHQILESTANILNPHDCCEVPAAKTFLGPMAGIPRWRDGRHLGPELCAAMRLSHLADGLFRC